MRTLFNVGAIGEIVKRAQSGLTAAGFDTKGTDGWYGNNTAAAVRDFQKEKSLSVTGVIDDNTWESLMDAPIPSIFERCLQLTASFENHGFELAVGNFDGALLTWGIIGFTMKSGEVQNIILAINDRAPDLVRLAFQADTDSVIAIMRAPREKQATWANSLTLPNGGLAQPWRSKFHLFGSYPEVQQEQIRRVKDDYWRSALKTAKNLGFTSELGVALCFDIHVQNGGVKPESMARIQQARTPGVPEFDLRTMAANEAADTAKPRWREDVRRRKLAIATGQGRVHEHTYIMQNMGLDAQFSAAELAGTD